MNALDRLVLAPDARTALRASADIVSTLGVAVARRTLPNDVLAAVRNVSERFGLRGFDGAFTGPRGTASTWRTSNSSANSELLFAMQPLRNRSRDLARNNAHANRALWEMVLAIIGTTGIWPRALTTNKDLNRVIDAKFRRWAKQCYPSSRLGWYGLQLMTVRSWLESGSVLSRNRPRMLEDRLPIPMQVQVLESDYLDPWRVGPLPNGGRIVQGVEYDGIGRIAAYWLYQQHPGDSNSWFGNSLLTKRVPESEVAHLFIEGRPGQSHGVPWLAPVIMTLKTRGDYSDAYLNRRLIESCITAFVSNDMEALGGMGGIGPTEPRDQGLVKDSSQVAVERLRQGGIIYTSPGATVTVAEPKGTPGYSEYDESLLHEISTGTCVPYARVSNNLKGTSFSSARIGQLPFKAITASLREAFLQPLWLDRVWEWISNALVLDGTVPLSLLDEDRLIPVKWTSPRFEEANRLEEVKADLLEVRAGLRSLQDVIASRGDDIDEVFREMADDNEKADDLNLILDSDPRKVSLSGVWQNTATSETPAPDKAAE